MDIFQDIPSYRAAVTAFAMQYGQHLPAATAQAGRTGNPNDAFTKAATAISVVDMCVQVTEALYAFNEDIADAAGKAAAQTLCGQSALMPGIMSWNVLSDNNRGPKIYWAMARTLGETAPVGNPWPDPSQDPAVDPQFAAAAAPATTAAPAPASPPAPAAPQSE